MKPHVICHMAASLDGRILPKRWRPLGAAPTAAYETIHERLTGDAWLIGRVSGQEFAKGQAYPTGGVQRLPREPWLPAKGAPGYAVILDAHGKIAWGRADIGGDPIVVVLTESVSDDHLAGLRADGVSYVFAGAQDIDLARVLEILGRELGIARLLLEGGGLANGGFLRAGLVDEVSVIVMPVIDGASGGPSLFHSAASDADVAAPITAMSLVDHEVLDGGAVWLRYALSAG